MPPFRLYPHRKAMPTCSPTTSTARRFTAARRGLALTELVVVLVVLATVALVAVPRLSQADTTDSETAVRGDLAVLRNAIELYAADHDGAYPPLDGFTAALTGSVDGHGPYLQAIPGPGFPSDSAVDGGPSSPRLAAFPGPATRLAEAPGPAIAWMYDEQSGRIQPNVAALR